MAKKWVWIIGGAVFLLLLLAVFSGEEEPGDTRDSHFDDLQKEAEASLKDKDKKVVKTKLSEHQAKDCVEKDGKWCTSVTYGTGWSDDCMSSLESCQEHRAGVLQDKSICETIGTDWKRDRCVKNVDLAMNDHNEG